MAVRAPSVISPTHAIAGLMSKKVELQFSIKNVDACVFKKNDRIDSDFISDGDGRAWRLYLRPKENISNKNYVGVYVELYRPVCNTKIGVRYRLKILSLSNKVLYEINSMRFSTTETRILKVKRDFISRKKLKDERKKFVINNTLIIGCEIEVFDEKEESRIPPLQLQDHFQQLFDSGAFCDIVIKCGDGEFFCSKAILAARSEVFKAMFESDMKESKTGIVEVSDMATTVLKQMLKFIYTGRPYQYDKDTAIGVLGAAHQYRLERLKIMCEEALIATVTLENAMELLNLSKLYSMPYMRSEVKKFLASFKPNELADTFDKIVYIE